jgi:YbbR domain-containing protein
VRPPTGTVREPLGVPVLDAAAGRPPRTVRGWIRGALFDNLAIKFVAMVLSVTVFILVHSDEEAVLGVYHRISYNMPTDRVLVSDRVDQVRLTLQGPYRKLRALEEKELDPIRIDLGNFQSGELELKPRMFHLPRGLEVQSITPQVVTLSFERRVEKEVPVVPAIAGEPARGWAVASVSATPPAVLIAGAESAVRQTTQVHTEEISLTGRAASFRARASLKAPRRFVELPGDPTVEVDVVMAEQQTARPLGEVAVVTRAGGGVPAADAPSFVASPATVKIAAHGPRLAVDAIDPAAVTAFVELHPPDVARPGTRPLAVQVAGIPPGVAVEIQPREVTVRRRPR